MNEILSKKDIILNLPSESKKQAIIRAGNLLMNAQAVTKPYIKAMLAREKIVSTYIGNHLAIPHGIDGSQKYVSRTAIAVLHYPQGVDFNGNCAYFVIAIASQDDSHLAILANIAEQFENEDTIIKLKEHPEIETIYKAFTFTQQ